MSEAAANAVFAILILLVVAALVIRGLAWNQVKGLLARGWPTCQGTVEFGSVEERHTRYKNFYVGRIDYSYSGNGEYYSGCHERLFVWEGSANRFVDGMKKMKKQMVFVRYKPDRPERSALLKQDQPAGQRSAACF